MSKRRRTRPEASGGKRPRLLFLVSQCPARRFPAPWSAELQPNYYVVRDADGQQLAYIYYSNDPETTGAWGARIDAVHPHHALNLRGASLHPPPLSVVRRPQKSRRSFSTALSFAS